MEEIPLDKKGCSNCYWYPKCDHISRCEYYDPVITEGKIVSAEYEQALRERVELAREIELEMGE